MLERFDKSMVRKKGLAGPIRLEAETLRFISANTTIPVPHVYNLWEAQDGKEASFTMNWIEGQTTWEGLAQNLTRTTTLCHAHAWRFR